MNADALAPLQESMSVRSPRHDHATAFAPACVGNVGVGFDILGHSMAGAGDRAEVRRIDEPAVRIAAIRGTTHELPLDAQHNTAGEAAPSAGDHTVPSASPNDSADNDGSPAAPKASPSSSSAAAHPLRATVPDSSALPSRGDHPTRHLTGPGSRTSGGGKTAARKKSLTDAPGQARKGRR